MKTDKQNIYFVLQGMQSLAALTSPECVEIAALAMHVTQRLPAAASVSFAWNSAYSVELACRAKEFAKSNRIKGITPEGVTSILCELEETAQFLVKIATLPQEQFSKVVAMAYDVYMERRRQKTLSVYYGEMLKNFIRNL